ncbi:dicarboxylate transporter/tellurite-resistance protein TehA [Variovorax sp. PAMC 28711]|uniref:dicarboxylate transporter/tellurite-resistance protein TehA n=1 Tax=Variovorax sp. PAMC 28711 TaxID=1795631 RepID=UPI00078BCAA6|nr:dicarboxylate transporter/tellurite-resistance protein TehA [Variovorax sp. PAMC 28711]AMM24152.1 tellurite resistance protein TehA [Variovorax sp. PAMC 28711]
MTLDRAPVPVSFFSIAVGVLALGNAWRVAERLWHLPHGIADLLTWSGIVLWLALLALYAHKWLHHASDARAELNHPVQSSFAALGPVSSLLAAMALEPHSHPLALAVFALAVTAQLALGLQLYGRMWQGSGKPELITPAIYLPAVAQNFVAGAAAAAFGWPSLGMLFFGAGLFSWLAIESLILSRAALQGPLPEALRPVLGIQLAPAVVGGVTYLAVNGGKPDLFAQILLGYGLYQALLLLRLLPWIARQPFVPSYWAFSFGVAALPTLALRLLASGATGPVEWLAPALFAAANVIIGVLAFKTVALLLQGRLLPAVTAPR